MRPDNPYAGPPDLPLAEDDGGLTTRAGGDEDAR